MPRRRRKDVDFELDLHGYTGEEMLTTLRQEWPSWQGMQRVRLVHGRGSVLKPAVETWCREMGVPFEIEPNNPGSALIYPAQRSLPDEALKVYLKEKGLTLTPEEEAHLRDPEAVRRARIDGAVRKLEAERKKQTEAATKVVRAKQDESLWQAEIQRLNTLDRRNKGKKASDTKPSGPVIIPPSEIKHGEGWWKAELVRVADTDHPTLLKQKRTGLEKLAPPIAAQKPEPEKPSRKARPERDVAADQALFEEELKRLGE